eukprot:CAMPEP_0119414434 /NCGR_PEP_ID=MMETSP1335-20130426/6967_1 /TAXON_ID=259385 /ORGANISM="Chrysoculter rhomboideus, Strain RCC1486" /LENGTH=63 /DNA_ID=CAMNT_0007439315 /DNA_START=339 /DNA_END=530 /DNA_ORIENTATION=+
MPSTKMAVSCGVIPRGSIAMLGSSARTCAREAAEEAKREQPREVKVDNATGRRGVQLLTQRIE